MGRTQAMLATLLFACLAGCTVKERLLVDGGGSLTDMPGGPVAVLWVASRAPEAPKSGPFIYGVADTPLADAAFAELLAVAMRDDAGLAAMHPYDVEKRLRQKGVIVSLQPDAEQLTEEAAILGCNSYLTAEVGCWRQSFLLFASSAELRCRISCRRSDDDVLIWRADIDARMRGRSDRELARLALREMVEWLSVPHPAPDPNPPPLICE